jgi:3-hydroxyacyl-CoA dehydrogenase
MSDVVSWAVEGNVGVITINSPPVNALSAGVRQGLYDGMEALVADDAAKAIVVICEGRTFIAGADITEFGKPPSGAPLRDVQTAMEVSPKPVIAAIHGTALGGGLETALACHYRCAIPSAKVGLPEVKLGLLPGAGGTQRLPRIIGPKRALDMIIDGNPISAAQALELGVVNHVIEGDLREGALAYAQKLIDENAPTICVSANAVDASELSDTFFDDYRKSIARKTRGFPAPEKIIQCIEAAVNLPFDEGMIVESKGIGELMQGSESEAMRYMFFSEREVAKLPDVPKDTPLRDINSAAVLGAGTMGGGIAMNFANAGIPVTIVEMNQEALDRGLGIVETNYRNTQKKGRLTEADVDARLGLISGTLDYADIGDKDIVIEAIFENMDVKKEVFTKLDATMKQGAILATNTSYLNIDEIAQCTSRPGDVIGLHFFSPANVMRLLEVVRGAETSKEVLATCMAMAKRIGKLGVVAGVCHGFIGNRMLSRYSSAAQRLMFEGATPNQIDQAIFNFGMPMGPFTMGDLAGLDVGWRARQDNPELFPTDTSLPNIVDILVEQERFGQKTQKGYYLYEAGNRTPIPDPEVEAMIKEESIKAGIEQRDVTDEEIVQMALFAAINEGARVLEEGIAYRPCDIDMIWINGYGFPSYRGGPMHYADLIGVDKVHAAVEKYRQKYGDANWKYSRLLENIAKAGGKFADWKDYM